VKGHIAESHWCTSNFECHSADIRLDSRLPGYILTRKFVNIIKDRVVDVILTEQAGGSATAVASLACKIVVPKTAKIKESWEGNILETLVC